MKILQVSTGDIGGGAFRASYRLHQSLRDKEVDSQMAVMTRLSRDPSIFRFAPSTKPLDRIARAVRRFRIESAMPRRVEARKSELFTEDRTWLGGQLADGLPACDLIHLHWVSGFVDYGEFLPAVLRRTPVVWTLHDMNPFTGGCHFAGDCTRFAQCCGACPLLEGGAEADLTRQVWRRKEAALAGVPANRLKIVTPSKWLAAESGRSSLFGKSPVDVIPYGLDTSVFAPRDKRFAREVLGIPADVPVVLFVALSISDQRKGYRYLLEAMEPLPHVFLLSIGNGDSIPRKNALHLGSVNVDPLLALIYSAADVFVTPSLGDNLPQTVLEAMACGVPVAAFDVGGIPDAVEHDRTGLLVPAADSRALRAALESILGDPDKRAQMSACARESALARFGLQKQADAYLAIYNNLLKS